MRLFIAEKPSLGRAIAQFLPAKGVPRGPAGSPPTHIVAGDDVVTWCFGHLLEMAEPEDYSEAFKKWDFSLLPMVPDEWRLIPKDDAKGQIKAIKALLDMDALRGSKNQDQDIDAALEDGAAGGQRRVEIGIAGAEVGDEGGTVLRLGAGKGLGDA